MVPQVIVDYRGDKEIAVIVAFAAIDRNFLAHGSAGFFQQVRV
jgi:hypothetical protein